MLNPATPFPQPGSYGLYEDPEQPRGLRRAELARVIELGASVVLIALPLVDGAGGNKRVPLADLTDGTPLTGAEKREELELFRLLVGKVRLTPRQREKKAHHDALRSRQIWSGVLQRRLDELSARNRAKAA